MPSASISKRGEGRIHLTYTHKARASHMSLVDYINRSQSSFIWDDHTGQLSAYCTGCDLYRATDDFNIMNYTFATDANRVCMVCQGTRNAAELEEPSGSGRGSTNGGAGDARCRDSKSL